MNLGELLIKAKALAEESFIPLADFMYVSSYYLKLSSVELGFRKSLQLTAEQEAQILSAFQELSVGKAPQYITKTAWFYGLELYVDKNVLIPRPETEGLVEFVMNKLIGNEKVLDIGTGSGAIALALKHHLSGLEVHATDVSSLALQVASSNADKHGLQINFWTADLFPQTALEFDCIVSNPPYISHAEMLELERRVKNWEPELALQGGDDGLDYYRRLLASVSDYLKLDGFVALEHGALQREAICRIAKAQGFGTVEAYHDLQGRDRYLLISY